MQYVQDITLDIYGTALYYVTSKQYDNAARYIRVQLTENGTPIKVSQDLEAHIRALKPDGHSVDNAAEILEDGRVQAELTEQILACEGVTLADIVILDGDTVLSSVDFRIECGKAPVGKNVDSKDEFLVLVEATKNAREATEAANKAAENVKSTDNSIKEAEEARVKAEAERVTAEEARVEAERARADEHTQAMEDVDTAVQAAGKATADAQEVADHPDIIQGRTWWKWDKDADTYVDTGKRAVLGIDKVYPSVAELEADTQPEGTIAIIQSDVNTEDNAKLYTSNGDGWVFVTDLSGFAGVGIEKIELTEGNHSPGTSDTYTITLDDGREVEIPVYNGADGHGDMDKSVYDPDNHATDIFGYVDEAVKNVKIDMDATPTESSQNAVQSGGVYTALAGKQDKLTFDDVPTENSVNPVKSGGVYGALQRKSNQNLLDNWYFVGGGTQKGGGHLPINQRGQTEYASPNGSTKVSIDRWLYYGNAETQAAGYKLSLNDGFVSFGPRTFLGQHVESTSLFEKQVTFSCLLTDGLYSGTIKLFPEGDGSYLNYVLFSNEKVSLSARRSNSIIAFLIGNEYALDSGNNLELIAAKLELGSEQTLAHQDENGEWVLNDPPPNFQQELAKCQRYLYNIIPIFSGGQYVSWYYAGIGLANSTTDCLVKIDTPTTMRIAPTVVYEGKWALSPTGLVAQGVEVISMNISNPHSDGYLIRAVTNGGLTPGAAYYLIGYQDDGNSPKKRLILDASI